MAAKRELGREAREQGCGIIKLLFFCTSLVSLVLRDALD